MAVVSTAVENICDLALFHSSRNANGLYSLFDVQDSDETEMIALPPLDKAFEKFGSELSEEVLIKIVRTSFQTHADNFIDEVFPEFLAGPLSYLLDDPHSDAMNNEGGAGMEDLYAVAFAKKPDKQSLDRLWVSMEEYLEKMCEYDFGDEEAFFDALRQCGAPRVAQKLDALNAADQDLHKLRAALEGNNETSIAEALDNIGNINDEEWEKLGQAYEKALDRNDLPVSQELAAKTFGVLLSCGRQDQCGSILEYVLSDDLETGLSFLQNLSDDAEVNKEIGSKLESKILYSYPKKANADPELKKRQYLMRKTYCAMSGKSEDDALMKELQTVILWRLENHRLSFVEKFSYFHELDTIPLDAHGQIVYAILSGLEDTLGGGSFQDVIDVLPQLKKVEYRSGDLEKVLALVIVAPIHNGSDEGMDMIFEMMPEEITFDVLAYNLSCYYARKGKREELLEMIAKSIALGKDKSQFLDDDDFKPYLEDQDFQAALAD